MSERHHNQSGYTLYRLHLGGREIYIQKRAEQPPEETQEAFDAAYATVLSTGILSAMRKRSDHYGERESRIELYLSTPISGPRVSMRWAVDEKKGRVIFDNRPLLVSKGVSIEYTQDEKYCISHTMGSRGEGKERRPADWIPFAKHPTMNELLVRNLKLAEKLSEPITDYRNVKEEGITEYIGHGKIVEFKNGNNVLLK